MLRKAVFLDRDGVITEDPPHYAHRLDQLHIVPGSARAIRLLNIRTFHTIVITNQSGVAQGYYTEDDVEIFNNVIKSLIAESSGAHIDAISYCPHHPDALVERYRISCDCRKPKPGMILAAAQRYSLALEQSFVVGDKWSDIDAGRAAGCKTVLVLTGHGKEEYSHNPEGHADYIADNLLDAVEHYIIPESDF